LRVSVKCSEESVEAGGVQHVGDAAVEAFNHAVDTRGSRLDQTMLNMINGTDLIEDVEAGRLALAGGAEAIGKFFTVVGEDLVDLE